MPTDNYDVIVLGGGAGGIPAAIRAAQLGGRVAIVENENLGGACMNSACIPFGHMMLASEILGTLPFGKELGLDFSYASKNFETLMKRQNELIAFMRQGATGVLNKNKVTLIEGKGKILGNGLVGINGSRLSCKNIILATGSKWVKPQFPGAESEEVINTDGLLREQKIPGRVLLLGRNPWLIEIAQFLHRFGSKVLLLTDEKTFLSQESKTISSRLRKALAAEGLQMKVEGSILKATKKREGMVIEFNSRSGTEVVTVDRVLTLDRAALLEGLGLRNVNLDENAPYLNVNSKMETGANGVYAVGDMTADPTGFYSHRASQGGMVAAENAMGKTAVFNPKALVRVLFTQPNVAAVGLTPQAAKEQGYDVVVGSAPYGLNPLGMMLGDTTGIVEVVTEKKYGEILGVHFIGRGASEMVGQALLAIQAEMTVEDLARASFPHPTFSESIAEAAREALGVAIYLP